MNPKYPVFCGFLLGCMLISGCVSCDFVKSEEPEDLLEKYRNSAKEAYDNQNYNSAEKNYLLAITEYEKSGLKSSTTYGYISKVYMMQGRYNEAANAELKCFDRRKNELSTAEFFFHYSNLSEIYRAQGKLDEARKAVEWLIEKANQDWEKGSKHPTNSPNYVNSRSNKFWIAHPSIGKFYIQVGEYEKAIQYLQEHVNYCLGKTTLPQNIAKAKNNLAMAYYTAGDEAAAERLFQEAGVLNTQAFAGFPTDLAQSLTILGQIAAHRGQNDKALEFFNLAREALHSYRTLVYKVEEADVLNQVGRFYINQGKPEAAAKAFHEAIGLRQATATATHPNYADAIRGLADVAACRGELTSATLHAETALRILDTALMPTHPRISPTLIALTALDELTGKADRVEQLNMRLETILQKPLGPWKEDFLETAAFYAGLLDKADKTFAATRLKQLAAQQKERR